MNIEISKKSVQTDPVLQEMSSFTFKDQDINKKISTFSNSLFSLTYRIGKLGNIPLKFLAERFQTLRFKDSINDQQMKQTHIVRQWKARVHK